MHKRKMKINRRQRKYKPWEILPLGTRLSAFVFAVDENKKRVELTTFPPQLWEEMLPKKTEEDIEEGILKDFNVNRIFICAITKLIVIVA